MVKSIHGSDGKLEFCRIVANKKRTWGMINNINKALNLRNIDLRNMFYITDKSREWGLENDGKFTVSFIKKLIDCHTLEHLDFHTYWNKLKICSKLFRRGMRITRTSLKSDGKFHNFEKKN